MTDSNHKTDILQDTPVWLGYRYLIYAHQTHTDTPSHRAIVAVCSDDPATCEHTVRTHLSTYGLTLLHSDRMHSQPTSG